MDKFNPLIGELQMLSRDELIELIDAYDTYIINFVEDNLEHTYADAQPGDLMTFYDNEWMNREVF